MVNILRVFILFLFSCFYCQLFCQETIKGKVRDGETGEPIYSANIIVVGESKGITTDFDGEFKLKVESLPVDIQVSFIGYQSQTISVSDSKEKLTVSLKSATLDLGTAEVVGERISEKQKQNPLTVESMDVMAIKEAPSGNFYESLGTMKGVDMTSASLGFKVINTRGFNSTTPVRSLQLIDGVDNQSPGLNFSLGNFLGAPDLDVKKVDIVAGASSAFFGPGAFNGVVNMETKSPFIFPGFSFQLKVGERRLFNQSFRFADIIQNKKGEDAFAYKLNFYHITAYDWEANNYDAIDGSRVEEDNPAGYDAVNIYGDQYRAGYNYATAPPWSNRGLGIIYRTGYKEEDLVDYNTENLKANFATHLRVNPEDGIDSPELVYSFNIGNGTTVYQGDNRFALRNIVFWQNKLEFKKQGKYFIRAYSTKEDAGNSYDPFATALALQNEARLDEDWIDVYVKYWNDSIDDGLDDLGYPQLEWDPEAGAFTFDNDSLDIWLDFYQDSLTTWHNTVENWANNGNAGILAIDSLGFYEPGSPEFNEAYNRLIRLKNNQGEGGTKFFDQSALYHVHGEYIFEPSFTDNITVGANMRWYRPDSDGTIFIDTADVVIKNQEVGFYTGIQKKFLEDRIIVNGTIRFDKNQNFDWVNTPAISAVFTPSKNHYLRASLSSALRNPTLSDQYLYLNVGPAILAGNLNGADSLITLSSFSDFRNTLNTDTLDYFNISAIQPEQVRTFEVGYRATFFDKMYVDLGYYFSIYKNFIGYNIGIESEFSDAGLPQETQVFRYASNSLNEVQTQGFSIGANYYLKDNWVLAANYSWNKLLKADEDDPIIPAFNTPEHKYNISFSVRDIEMKNNPKNVLGFSANYKWIQGFLFEGSPQFTGFVPTYDMVDAQINLYVDKLNSTIKFGASNLLNNYQFQTYGGPRIGRLAYFSILYEFDNR